MKKIIVPFLFPIVFLCFSLTACGQGWVPQRFKADFRDSTLFRKDVQFLDRVRIPEGYLRIGSLYVSSNAAELNILDGALVNSTELNYLVGVTSGVQSQINAKANSNNTSLTGTVGLPATTSIGLVSAAELGWFMIRL